MDLQGAAQKWVCHSISKTVNLPSDATVETVKQVYMRAWKAGCKGITVYRDGSRDGVLLNMDDGKKDASTLPQTQATKRPKELACDIHRAQVTERWPERSGEGVTLEAGRQTHRYIVLVGLLEGRPYEVFCGLADRVEVPRRYQQGTLIKSRRVEGVATYDLHIDTGDKDEPIILKNVVDIFDDPEGGAVTRMASLSLRHGVPVQYVVEQLQKDKHSGMHSLTRVVARILKGYIPDGTVATAEKTCTYCGSSDIRYQEHCPTCVSCGNGKCG